MWPEAVYCGFSCGLSGNIAILNFSLEALWLWRAWRWSNFSLAETQVSPQLLASLFLLLWGLSAMIFSSVFQDRWKWRCLWIGFKLFWRGCKIGISSRNECESGMSPVIDFSQDYLRICWTHCGGFGMVLLITWLLLQQALQTFSSANPYIK